MISPFEVWKRTLWRWAAPLAFCVANLIVLAIYFQFYAGRVDRLSERLDDTQSRLQSYQEEHAESQAFLASLQQQEQQVDALYVDHFQTEQQRFTSAIREVKRLAREAGLQPSNLSYPSSGKASYELAGRDIIFSVEGTYRQMRTFINFLELSDQFLTLREVGLTGSEGGNRKEPRLSIRLRVSTYFHRRQIDPAPDTVAASQTEQESEEAES